MMIVSIYIHGKTTYHDCVSCVLSLSLSVSVCVCVCVCLCVGGGGGDFVSVCGCVGECG